MLDTCLYDNIKQGDFMKLYVDNHRCRLFKISKEELVDTPTEKTQEDAKEKSDDKKDNSNKKSSGKEKDKELDFDINLDEPAADSEQEEPTSKKSDDADSGEEVPQEQPTTDIAGDELAQPENDTATTDVAEPEQPVQKQRPGQIDVSVFASKVSNLVNNIENLLDIKSVIINRAHKIITTNYGEKDAKEFKQALASKHKMKTADAYDKPY